MPQLELAAPSSMTLQQHCAHLLLNAVLSAEAEDLHLLLLANAVSSIHGLSTRRQTAKSGTAALHRCFVA
jgi:hypothetical protein